MMQTQRAECSGMKCPAYIIMERGVTCQQWMRQPRRFSEQLTFLEQMAELLAVLHSAGRVHRDMKPANVLWMLNSTGALPIATCVAEVRGTT